MSNSPYPPHGLQPRDDNATASPTSPPPSSTSVVYTHISATNPPHGIFHHFRTTYQHAGEIISYIHLNPTLPLASALALLGLVAEIEQPGFILRPTELSIGLVAAFCAGGVIFSVLALDQVGGDSNWLVKIEGCWGATWRWVQDRYTERGKGEEVMGEEEGEATMMFGKSGTSVFLQDTPLRTRPTTPLPQMSEPAQGDSTPQQASEGTSPQNTPALSGSLIFEYPPVHGVTPMNSPPSPHRQEHVYASSSSTQPSLRQPTPRRAHFEPPESLHISPLRENNHASGLLGPSPMPPRRTASNEWKNFTGQGFYKYQQKLEAVNEWSNPGSRRTFEEVMRGVRGKD